MSRLPTDDVLQALVVAAGADLARIGLLWPSVRAQRRLGHYLGSDLPTSAFGEDLSAMAPPLAYSDPTGEMATSVNRLALEEHLDREALHGVLDALMRVGKARQALCARLPAVDANIAAVALGKRKAGQPGTALVDSAVLGTRTTTLKDCTLCERESTRIRSGMCNACYSSWSSYKVGRTDADRDEFRRWRLASLAA